MISPAVSNRPTDGRTVKPSQVNSGAPVFLFGKKMIRFILIALLMAATPAIAAPSTKCLPPQIKRVLSHLEQFGRVEIVSAYRKGAVIAGTHKPSKHAACLAVDFHLRGNRVGAARWLSKQPVEWIRYTGQFHHWHVATGSWKGWKR